MAEPQQPSSSHRQRVNPRSIEAIAGDNIKSRQERSSFHRRFAAALVAIGRPNAVRNP
jgi:hypothetical protein